MCCVIILYEPKEFHTERSLELLSDLKVLQFWNEILVSM